MGLGVVCLVCARLREKPAAVHCMAPGCTKVYYNDNTVHYHRRSWSLHLWLPARSWPYYFTLLLYQPHIPRLRQELQSVSKHTVKKWGFCLNSRDNCYNLLAAHAFPNRARCFIAWNMQVPTLTPVQSKTSLCIFRVGPDIIVNSILSSPWLSLEYSLSDNCISSTLTGSKVYLWGALERAPKCVYTQILLILTFCTWLA